MLKGLGKASGVIELGSMGVEGYGLLTDENLRAQRVAELEDAARKGAGFSAVSGALNPVGTAYALSKLASEASKSGAAAEASGLAADKAAALQEARLKARRSIVSDEDLKQLPAKERSAIMQQIRASIR